MISYYSTKTTIWSMLKINNILQFIILIILIISINELASQPLTLDSCKAHALRNNVTIQNAQLDVQAAEQVKKQALTKYFPSVSATALGYHAINPLLELGIDDIDNAQARNYLYDLYAEYGSAMGLPNSLDFCKQGLSVGATLMQPVFAGGRIVNGNKLATVGVEAAKLQSELSEEQVLLTVEENYWLIVSLYEKRQTILQALALLDTLHRDIITAQEAGLVTANDPLKVTLKENEMRSNLLKVENGIVLATMALCQLTGLPYSPDLTLSDTVVIVETDATTDVSAAVAQRKESALLDMSVRAERLKKKMIVGEALPQVAVGAGASYGSMVLDRYSANGLAFATVQVPLTNWWETSHKIKEQNIRIQQAENTRADLTGKMALEVQQAVNNVREAYAQITLAESTVRDASTSLATARVNFEAGLIPVSEFLEAQTLHSQALNQLTDARIDYRNKCAKLEAVRR